eukprot:2578736-Rhodomonas_salina.1
MAKGGKGTLQLLHGECWYSPKPITKPKTRQHNPSTIWARNACPPWMRLLYQHGTDQGYAATVPATVLCIRCTMPDSDLPRYRATRCP